MKLQNRLVAGRMNKDDDERLVPNGEFVHAENIRVSNSEGSNQGAAENVLGNYLLTSTTPLSLGNNPITIGAYADNTEDKIYWFVVDRDSGSSKTSWIFEYDVRTNTKTQIMQDFGPSLNVLNFDENYLIASVDMYLDSDNGRRFLAWTDNYNPPRLINVDYVKTLDVGSYVEDDVSLIKKPPINPPTLNLLEVNTEENNINEKFLCFSYRYRYLDQQYSAPSPFSYYAFEASDFSFDYSTSSNKGMVNKFNGVKVEFETGSSLVEGVDLMFKESGTNNLYLIESFDKDQEGWADNSTASFVFTNNKNYIQLSSEVFNLIYDAVPRKCKTVTFVDNRLMIANYLENYNISNSAGVGINIDFNALINSTTIVSNTPTKSLKSNRSYETAIVYLDDYGRATAPLTSKDNTVFIENSKASSQNKLRLVINNLPPSWAQYYRIYLKQSQEAYDTISPTIFYNDGVFIWIKMEGDDKNKISEGDFLWVKSDTTGLLKEAVQVEILEIKEQRRNFLETSDKETIDTADTVQEPGIYFRVKASDFQLNLDNASVFRQEAKGFRSRSSRNNFLTNIDYIDDPVYYGPNEGLDDMTSGGIYSGTEDIRYLVEIDAVGTPDTFRWSDDDGVTWTSGVSITTSAQTLNNGVQITFVNSTGHDIDDYWIVPAKSADIVSTHNNSDRSAWTCLQGKTTSDETIRGGSLIKIKYKEQRRPNTRVEEGFVSEEYETTFTSSQDYANIEEWWYGDNIVSSIEWPSLSNKVLFRRGDPDEEPVKRLSINSSANLYMIFESRTAYSGGEVMDIDAEIEIIEFDNKVIFETKSPQIIDGIFYELGETFDISGGYHQGNITNQTDSLNAVLELQVFNCFSWGNGYESYKIRDKVAEKSFNIDYRFSQSYENYRENTRTSSIITSEPYNQSTGFNGFNSFNIFKTDPITKDLDERYSDIVSIRPWNTDLLVFQEDKIHKVLINKSIVKQSDGSDIVTQFSQTLGQEIAYSGNWGCQDPSTIVQYNDYWYWLDTNRGTPLRLAGDGITPINYGMRNYFRDKLSDERLSDKFGGYDPNNGEYIVTILDQDKGVTNTFDCGSKVFKKDQLTGESYTYIVNIDDDSDQFTLDLLIVTGSQISVTLTYDGSVDSNPNLTGNTTINIGTTNFNVRTVSITITAVVDSTYVATGTCRIADVNDIYQIVLMDKNVIPAINTIKSDSNDYLYFCYVNEISGTNPVNNFSVPYNTNEADEVSVFKKTRVNSYDDDYPSSNNRAYLSGKSAGTFSSFLNENLGHKLGYLYTSTVYGKADVDDIISAATFVTPLVTNVNTREIDIPLTVVDDNNLYLIYDLRSNTLTAVDNTVDVIEDEYEDINVLENDTIPNNTPVVVTIASQGTKGTAEVLSSGVIRYRHDTALTGSDSFTYTVALSKDSSVNDTATVNINIISGGGLGATGHAFSMSTSGSSTTDLACGGSTLTTRYHGGRFAYPSLDSKVYLDVNKNTIFNGNNLWYTLGVGLRLIKIDTLGRVVEHFRCNLDEDDIILDIP